MAGSTDGGAHARRGEGAARRHRVFVYGTLRRGGSNHHLLRDAVLLWAGRTAEDYELVDFGDYPGLVEGGRTAVHGEIYAVDDAVLQSLDVLEEVPDYYQRKRVDIGGWEAFIYVLPAHEAEGWPRIPSGVWPVGRR